MRVPVWGCGPRTALVADVMLWLQEGFLCVTLSSAQLNCAPGCKGPSVESAGVAGGTGRAPKVMVWALVTQEYEQMCFNFRACCSTWTTEKCKVLLH